jgi:hypothetical protein
LGSLDELFGVDERRILVDGRRCCSHFNNLAGHCEFHTGIKPQRLTRIKLHRRDFIWRESFGLYDKLVSSALTFVN